MSMVSVIVPNYNHAPFLKERLDSVLAQDYPDYEVILLDDCSSDNSMQVLESYRSHPRVRVVIGNAHNSGNTFIQWRRGLEMAQGKYVWIAESDDVAESCFLSRLVPLLEQHPEAQFAYSASLWIDQDGKPIPRPTTYTWQRGHVFAGDEFIRHYLLGYNHVCNASAVLMRREAALRVSDQCTRYRASGDRQFWIEMALQGEVIYASEVLNRFRQHTHKVSGPAESRGQNVIEDHIIYQHTLNTIALSRWQRCLICGYHWQAIAHGRLSAQGQQQAMQAWHVEPEFNRLSHLLYIVSRIIEKCRS